MGLPGKQQLHSQRINSVQVFALNPIPIPMIKLRLMKVFSPLFRRDFFWCILDRRPLGVIH